MSAVAPCPKCGEQSLRRSRSKSKFELYLKKLKSVNPYRLYRCRNCGWRGWIGKLKAQGQIRIIWKKVGFYFGVMVFAFFIGLWVISSIQ